MTSMPTMMRVMMLVMIDVFAYCCTNDSTSNHTKTGSKSNLLLFDNNRSLLTYDNTFFDNWTLFVYDNLFPDGRLLLYYDFFLDDRLSRTLDIHSFIHNCWLSWLNIGLLRVGCIVHVNSLLL